ncbi:MAG: O-antigen ligase family protein [Taibaiella sp.]|nr:O-antigen ligase family protein [Taibaiella sp.]
MLKAKWLSQTLQYALCIVAFAIPFPFICSTLALLLLCAVWLLQCRPAATLANLGKRKALWPWLLYYILLAVSYTYSINKYDSLFDLQSKLSLFVLPVIIGAGMVIEKAVFRKVLLSFTIGVGVIAIYCLLRSTWIWQQTQQTQQFFYHDLIGPLDANAVYQAWYAIFSLSILLLYPREVRNNRTKIFRIVFFFIQFLFFVLLSSKTLILLFCLVVIPVYIRQLYKKGKLSIAPILAIVSGVLLMALLLVKTHNPIKQRYEDILDKNIQDALRKDYHQNSPFFSNLTLRLFVWRVAIENIKEHKLWLKGSGNGSVKELQNKKISEYGIYDIYNYKHPSPIRNMNIHNMYLQSLFMVGVGGLICFLLILFLPLFLPVTRATGSIFFCFFVISIFFMAQESALQTQAGIVFFSFFSALGWNIYYENKKLQLP